MDIWTADILTEKLQELRSKNAIFQWAFRTELVDREERYFIQDKNTIVSIDQSRSVTENSIFVKVEVEKSNDKLGSAERRFFYSHDLNPQLQKLLEIAQIGEEEKWSYEKNPSVRHIAQNKADPLIWESVQNATERLSDSLCNSIVDTKQAAFNSAELFVSRHKTSLAMSNGFRGEEYAAKIYAEICFSQTDREKNISEEYLITRWGARQDQMDFSGMCNDSAEYAAGSLRTQRPEPGKYSVLLNSMDLCILFNDAISHLSATSRYFGMPFIEKGEDFIPGFSGFPFRLSLDPEMNHTFGSSSFDEYGEPQKKLLLVDNNKVMNSITNKKMADYLKQVKNSSRGVVVVEPQKSSADHILKRSEPQVLEILQFSALFCNAIDLTFSSEIRLARLYNNKTNEVIYIKGGCVSGNFKENFAKVRWSDRKKLENIHEMYGSQSYYGPSHALLMDTTVSA